MIVTRIEDLDVEIIHGRVAGKDSHAEDTTVYRGQQSATVHRTPEIWLRDETGKEHHFRTHAVDGAREGHELVVVRSSKGQSVLRVVNFHAQTLWDYGALATDMGAWSIIRASCWKLFTVYLPVVLIATYLGSATGLSGGLIGSVVGFALNVLFFYCIYLGWRSAEQQAAKAEVRRAKLDELFRENGWILGEAA